MTSHRCSVVIGEDDGLELIEEPWEEHGDDASPLVQALQTFNALLALEPAKLSIEKPVPAKATAAASLLPPPSQRMRPPMPTAKLELRPSMPLLTGCAKQSTLLPPLAGEVRASLNDTPNIHVRGSMPPGMRVVIPPLQVRARGTPPVGTRTKSLPAVPRAGEPSRPSERRVLIPPLATREMSVTPESPPVDVPSTLEVPASDANEGSIAITPSARSPRRRRGLAVVASSLGAVGIALVVVVAGARDDKGATTSAARTSVPLVMPAAPSRTEAVRVPPPATVSPPAAVQVVAKPAAQPVAAPKVRAPRAIAASEPVEPKPARARRRHHHHDSKPETMVAATCAAEPTSNRAAKSEDLDSPFPE